VNRQAAEAIWCHGQPPDPLLQLINQAANGVNTVLICPDADLSGVRIAARIHDHLPPRTHRVDIGTSEHKHSDTFSVTTQNRIAKAAQRRDPTVAPGVCAGSAALVPVQAELFHRRQQFVAAERLGRRLVVDVSSWWGCYVYGQLGRVTRPIGGYCELELDPFAVVALFPCALG
jgi:hypothetical protein